MQTVSISMVATGYDTVLLPLLLIADHVTLTSHAKGNNTNVLICYISYMLMCVCEYTSGPVHVDLVLLCSRIQRPICKAGQYLS